MWSTGSIILSIVIGLTILTFINDYFENKDYQKLIEENIKYLTEGSKWVTKPDRDKDLDDPFRKSSYCIVKEVKRNRNNELWVDVDVYSSFAKRLYSESYSVQSFFKSYIKP